MSKLLGQLQRVTALSILLGVCVTIKVIESFSGVDMSWINPLFGIVSGGWLVAVKARRGGIGDDEPSK